jgi:hypothetical protein
MPEVEKCRRAHDRAMRHTDDVDFVPPLVGPLFERVPEPAQRALRQILRGFDTDADGPHRAFLGPPSWKVPLAWGRPVAPWEASFVLRDIVGCHDFGRTEKLAWEYAFVFNGVQMTLAHQKFGLRAYIDKQACEEDAAPALAQGMADAIAKAMPLLRKCLLADIADKQISDGAVNVENHYCRLRDQFHHFGALANASLADADRAEPIREVNDSSAFPSITWTNPAYKLRQKAGFERDAAVHAFFSFLEHLLLISFFLSGDDPAGGRLADFISAGWNVKFKRQVSLNDRESKLHYDRLVAIHDGIRNPAAHGGVHSDGADFSFLLPGIGPVKTHLVAQAGGRRSYRWHRSDREHALAHLGEAEAWLSEGQLAAAVRYGESGLPLFFVEEIRSELAARRIDLDALDEYIELLTRMSDDAANMDW